VHLNFQTVTSYISELSCTSVREEAAGVPEAKREVLWLEPTFVRVAVVVKSLRRFSARTI
jgi:hypothetical protein